MYKVALVSLLLAASPALAGSHYHADPVAKPAEGRIILRDLAWKCGDDGCFAGKSSSRPAIVCALLAREVGRLRSFTVAGEPIAPDQLEKCNARAD